MAKTIEATVDPGDVGLDEKKLKEMDVQHASTVAELRHKIYNLERKLARQSDYLDALHQRIMLKK